MTGDVTRTRLPTNTAGCDGPEARIAVYQVNSKPGSDDTSPRERRVACCCPHEVASISVGRRQSERPPRWTSSRHELPATQSQTRHVTRQPPATASLLKARTRNLIR